MTSQGDRPDFNAGLGFERSYYTATAVPFAARPQLAETLDVDVCVIGGGCTGLSAALHLAEAGRSVALLEGGRIGWGASGRNGGQIIPGLRLGPAELIRRFGRERARALFTLAVEARDLVVGLIERQAIACDLKLTGHVTAAAKPGDLDDLASEAALLAEAMGYGGVRVLDRPAFVLEVGSPAYFGGSLDPNGGHYHPLNYTLGLARAAERAGVRLFERSAAVTLDQSGRARVGTAQGAIACDRVILAGDAFLGRLGGPIAGHIMPVASYIGVTQPLGSAFNNILPTDRAVSDTRFVVNYFRRTADGRLLFGGGERYTPRPPSGIARFVTPFMHEIFPGLADVRTDFAWGGLVSVTMNRLPHVGRRGPVLFAHGYSGLGAVLATLCGKLMAEAVLGTGERDFELFESMAAAPFPGGIALRGPLHVLGMLWYALRDRL